MELFKNTFYINLEKRKDRNEHVLNELRKIGIKGKRFNAIVAKDGAVGCTLSHIRLLEIAMKEDYEEIKEHVNCKNSLDEFKNSFVLNKTLYSGELRLDKFTRYMIIGIK